LGVANVLEGTVRRNGNRVRVSTELIDARQDKTTWADSFDRDLTDIFAIQSEVAQTIAAKLAATLSPEEKRNIEKKPTENLEAYDLYLRAKELLVSAKVSMTFGDVEKPLVDAVNFLEQAVRLDPKFALAYCASAEAHDLLYYLYDPTPEQRALGEAAVNSALGLQPDLPEVHRVYAYHLYRGYHDYERARVQLGIARRGLPNDAEAIALEALMDRRQGQFAKAIQEFNEAITRDPHNSVFVEDLALTLYFTRQFRAAEQIFDRLIELRPDQPILKAQKPLFVTFFKTGDDTAVRTALAALPASMADDRGALSMQLVFALVNRDWRQAKELIEKMKGGDDEGDFAYGQTNVPVGCYSILLARLQEEQPGPNASFAETREQLNQKVQRSAGNANLLSQLAVVDALLNNKEVAIAEAKHAVELLPISKDALAGPYMEINLAVVYAWTSQLDLAFEKLSSLTTVPNGVFYGQLKREPYWEPLRKDPRYEKLLAELAPRD
jgi:tetratricopeptide (TPR) repeat protein